KTRERDASSGAGSSSSFGAVKSEWSGNAAVAAGSPGDTAAVLQISASSGGTAGPPSAQGPGHQSQPQTQPPQHLTATHSAMALDIRGGYPPETICTPTGPSPHDMALIHIASATSHTADAQTAANLPAYPHLHHHHHHADYATLSLSVLPPSTSDRQIPSPPSSATNTAHTPQGQGMQLPTAPTPPLPRMPPSSMITLPFGPLPLTTCEEMLPIGTTGPIQAAASLTRWETPPPTAAAIPGSATAAIIPTKYEMLPPSGMPGPGMLIYPTGGWELSSLELVPCGSGGSGAGAADDAAGAFGVLSPAPQVLQQQHQYQLGLQLQAQLQAQQQQLQEQQLQLQLQLAQLQALQQQHQRMQQLQQHPGQGQCNAPQGQGSPPSTWIPTSCGNPSPPGPPQPQPQPVAAATPPPPPPSQGMRVGAAPLQVSSVGRLGADVGMQLAPVDDALTEVWLSMLE
ncbi:hypothetical protein Vretimale_12027, partial [Volvox reticuliferus]